MSVAVARRHLPMNVPEFLGFLRSRPDEERWELIGGFPMMMAPPTIRHQRIASNLERLLNDVLRVQRLRVGDVDHPAQAAQAAGTAGAARSRTNTRFHKWAF